jgi:LacI family transcriptional regulator
MGYKNALEKHKVPFDKTLVYMAEHLSYDNGYNLASKIIGDHPDVDGVFASTDMAAAGMLTKCKKMGVDIPNKVSIIGFSNWFLTKVTSPTLSTIDQPGYEMGLKAFDLLYKELNQIKQGVPVNYEVIEIATKVILRNSTRMI